jgi:hypothetical protein
MSVAFDDSERIVTTSGGDSGRPPRRRLSLLSPRGKKAGIAVLVAIVLVGGALTVASWMRSPSTGAAVTALSPFAVPGRGAAVPFVEQEAESAATTGKILAADRHYGTLAAEASGRRAVTLTAVGQYVEFTLARPANAMSLRYSIPDSADGKGREATLDVIAGGSTVAVPVTSRYGWFYGEYPFTDTPGSAPHHFFDEARTLLGKTLPAGSQVRVQVPSPAASPSFTIDLADFEQVAAPLAKPAGALDVVTDFGADPTGRADATTGFQAAVIAGRARHRPVWVPAGTFTFTGHVTLDRVTLQGAGPWYSVLSGSGVGLVGPAGARAVTIRDLAVLGDVTARDDNAPAGAISGSLSDSLIDDVWLQHTEAGIWMDGPMDDLTVRDSRILDQTADGVNFHRGVTHSTVADTFVRNTGDDGLAMWSDGLPDTGSSFVHDTVVAPVLANNIAIYGGRDVTVSDNVVADTVTNGGGLHVANRFDGVRGASAVSGTFTLARNTLIRAGNADTNWNYGVGALWFDGLNAPITGAKIAVTATDIVDSSYEAIQFVEGTITGVSFSDVTITGAGTYALQIQAPGSASFDHVTATGIAQSTSIYQCPGTDFAIAQGTGNAGWFTVTPVCGAWPEPQWQDGFTAPARAAAPVSMASTAATIAPPSAPVAGVTKAAKPTSSPTPHKTTKKPAPVDTTTDVARGKPVQESGHTDVYPGQNVTDGSATTYWESPQNAFPASVTIDLGKATTLGRVVLKLPPLAAWNSRVQTLSVIGSTDGRTFTALSGSAPHTFDAAKGNTVTLRFARTQKRYVKVVITANAGWPAGQLSEVEAYGG